MSSLVFSIATATAVAQAPKSNGAGTAAVVAPFEVVSVKANKSGSDNMSTEGQDASFQATNIHLHSLLTDAYGIRYSLISGLPAWGDSESFDINAKVVDPNIEELKKLTPEQHNARIAMILIDRFHLKAHIEMKTAPVYELVTAKNGPKFKVDSPNGEFHLSKSDDNSGMPMSDDELTGKGMTLEAICRTLEGIAVVSFSTRPGLPESTTFISSGPSSKPTARVGIQEMSQHRSSVRCRSNWV